MSNLSSEESDTPAPKPAEEVLHGGVNVVTRVGSTVRRPVHPWTLTVQALLRHLKEVGFDGAPAAHGIDNNGREILDFVAGTVGNYPLTPEVRSEPALFSAAHLLRRFHDASVSGLGMLPTSWQLPPLEPVEVICHSDFAPYNCVFRDCTAVAIIDFDMARPGPRAWDLAYALYRFAPLNRPENPDSFGTISQQVARARQFLDAYGATSHQRAQTVAAIAPRLRSLIDFMRAAAEAGNQSFARHIAEGHLDLYLADIEYITSHGSLLDQVITGP